MRALDLSPLMRATVGFDRMMQAVDAAQRGDFDANGYPPYNIEKLDEDAYRITMAVAGFTEDELEVRVQDQSLVVTGRKAETEESQSKAFIYRGIASRAFERRFQLAEHIRVTGAALENGLLHVELAREIPEAMKPRTIAIGKGASAKAMKSEPKVIEGEKKAA